MSLNERYHKRNLTLINTSNSKTLSNFSTLRKIEDLKKKYINMNFQQKKNLKNIFKKITQLNNKYNSIESFKSKTLETETNYNNSKSKNILLIQTTDQLSLINPNLETYSNSNLYLNSNPNISLIILIILHFMKFKCALNLIRKGFKILLLIFCQILIIFI